MGYPSVKTLMTRLLVSRSQANELRKAMLDGVGLRVANGILSGFGVEKIYLPDGCMNQCQTPDMTIAYVNRGDTYSPTLCKVNGRYVVSSWGDIVESYDNRH